MTTYYHLTNLRTPLDPISQQTLLAFGTDYRLSLPIEAEPAPGITPATQSDMVNNGIVGLYVTFASIQRPETAPHIPLSPIPAVKWLPLRPSIVSQKT